MGRAAWLSGLHRGLFYHLRLSDPRRSHQNISRDGGSVALLLLLRLHAGLPASLPGGGLASVDEAWDEAGLFF